MVNLLAGKISGSFPREQKKLNSSRITFFSSPVQEHKNFNSGDRKEKCKGKNCQMNEDLIPD